MSQSLPPIDQSLVPAPIRSAGTKAVQLYDAALSFEGVLDQQLAQSLTDTLQPSSDGAGDGSGDGTGADAATSLTLQMLPTSLAQGLVSSGGLGLADQLYQALGGTTAPTKQGAK